MIKNEKQYLITKNKLNDMNRALEQSLNSKVKMNKVIYEAMLEGIKSQISDLMEEIQEYENLKQSN